MIPKRQLPKIFPETLVLAGGLDTMSPAMRAKPGFLRVAQNFECSIFGGYRRIAGYERFSGLAKPSDATYTVLAASSISGGAVGDTLTGQTSLATGIIIAVAASYFVLTATSGTYQAGENLQVAAVTKGVCTSPGVISGAPTSALAATYTNLAADYYRSLIAAVPGSGKILGVQFYNDVLYAFRNNAGATAADLYKSTTGGWTQVSLGRELSYTTGTEQIAEGSTITGATSGASGVLKRQTVRTGTVGSGNAVGTFIFSTVSGGAFQNGENLQVGGVTKAVASGVDSAITLLPNGRYEFVNANFTGSTNTLRMYGCDGVNRAFEFDGTIFVPINTGMTVDAPSHIGFHRYHLFLSFFGSVQHSSPGFPYLWSPILGASELATGETVTGFQVQPGTTSSATLAIFTQERLWLLYGTGSSDWVLVPYNDRVGAYPYTMQTLSQTVFLDLQGITDLSTTLNFGNFAHAVLTNQMKNYLADLRTTAIASSISRDLSQYRLFFTSGVGIYLTLVGNKVVGITPILFPDVVRCTTTGFTSDGAEVSFFGSDDGYVYQFEKGTSFDGDSIEAFFSLSYNFQKSPRTLKRYWDATLEITGSSYAEFSFGYSLGYGATAIIQPDAQTSTSAFSAVSWDQGFSWDSGAWDGTSLLPSLFNMEGEAENVSIAIRSNSDEYQPFTVTAAVLHWTPRREIRA